VLTRRDMVKLGIASAVIPAMAGKAVFAAPSPAVRLHKVVYDARIPASVAFGKRAQQLGAPVEAIDGDVTALWFNDLHFMWRNSKASVAGLTRPSSLFALEQMALLAGRRVVFRAEHRAQVGGLYTHRLAAPGGFVAFQDASPDWPAHMAQSIVRHAAPVSDHMRAQSMIAAPAHDQNALISWIIAAA
jgi:hypothetical protein